MNGQSRFYLMMVGLLLGLLQTGLFFQLAFTLSSTFGTFLLVTLSWLVGSAIGVYGLARLHIPTLVFLLLALLAYGACVLLLAAAPFDTTLWPLYAGLVTLSGFYPGVFFARMSKVYPARTLFLWENNGFIGGLVIGTLAFLVAGRAALWTLPVVVVVLIVGAGLRSAPVKAP